MGITARGALDKYRFNMFMRDLLGEKARDIFRSKGVLCIHGQEVTKFVFQGVHETICFGPAASGWQPGEAQINQVVFIGRNLDRKVRGRCRREGGRGRKPELVLRMGLAAWLLVCMLCIVAHTCWVAGVGPTPVLL